MPSFMIQFCSIYFSNPPSSTFPHIALPSWTNSAVPGHHNTTPHCYNTTTQHNTDSMTLQHNTTWLTFSPTAAGSSGTPGHHNVQRHYDTTVCDLEIYTHCRYKHIIIRCKTCTDWSILINIDLQPDHRLTCQIFWFYFKKHSWDLTNLTTID